MKKLFIISNESIFEKENKFYCDNIDLKSTPEGLVKNFEINIIARKSRKERFHEIKISNIKIFKTIFSFIIGIISSIKNKDSKYLIISISPYTFLACVFLRLFGKIPNIYLRSNGFEEYKSILGFIGPSIYGLMFSVCSKMSKFISCSERVLKGKKVKVVFPSQITDEWLLNPTKIKHLEKKLLYVGRLRKEKGIFSLIDIIKSEKEIRLSIVGSEKFSNYKLNSENITIKPIENNLKNLIKIFDDHNIFVLPSYTEGYPMVLLESLSRLRPVIIFNEIEHVKNDMKGIYVCERNIESVLKKINFILENYSEIAEEMKKNKIATKKEFINDLSQILKEDD